MQVKTMLRPLISLPLLAVLLLVDWSSADENFCNRPINMELCYPEHIVALSKRFLRFGRALTNDAFLRFGKRPYTEKRFLRFGRSNVGEPDLDNMIRLAIAHSQLDDAPVYRRKKRSVADASADAAGQVSTSSVDHPEGVSKREATGNASPLDASKRFMRFGRGGQDEDEAFAQDKRFMRFGKRFMRFGRGGADDEEGDEDTAADKRFMRFGKRFMRFGRGSDVEEFRADEDEDEKEKRFMRFGKRFMRFGRSGLDDEDDLSEDKRFMRFGKRFMRFGRDPVEAEKRFMRFGRGGEGDDGMDEEKRFMRFGRDPMEAEKRFMRFGKRDQEKSENKRFMRFGKRFMRFGKSVNDEAVKSKSEQSSS